MKLFRVRLMELLRQDESRKPIFNSCGVEYLETALERSFT